ncbi:hypothetical protein GCM10027511_19430 [Hymenobacter humi]
MQDGTLRQNAVLSCFDHPLGSASVAFRSAVPPFHFSPTMTQDQIKDLKGRAEALRRYL